MNVNTQLLMMLSAELFVVTAFMRSNGPMNRATTNWSRGEDAGNALGVVEPVEASAQKYFQMQQRPEVRHRLAGQDVAAHFGIDEAAERGEAGLVAHLTRQRIVLGLEIQSPAVGVGKKS